MTVIVVTTRLHVDAERDDAEWWPEARVDGIDATSRVAGAAWDLVEALTNGLPPEKTYRVEVEPWPMS